MRRARVALLLFCSACGKHLDLGATYSDGGRAYRVREIIGAEVSVYDDALTLDLPDAGYERALIFVEPVSGAISTGSLLDYGPADGNDRGGAAQLGTYLTAKNGISGIRHDDRQFFMMGVFEGRRPCVPAPALHFSATARQGDALATSFEKLRPKLCQSFFIGDGFTNEGSIEEAPGESQVFSIPTDAVRLRFGFGKGSDERRGSDGQVAPSVPDTLDSPELKGQLFARAEILVSDLPGVACGGHAMQSVDGTSSPCAMNETCISGQCTPNSMIKSCSQRDRAHHDEEVASSCVTTCEHDSLCSDLEAHTRQAYHCWLAHRNRDVECDGGGETRPTADAFAAVEACAQKMHDICLGVRESDGGVPPK